ncbi:tryptophan dimethylallyltransferase family protein [Streptomyces sp. NPDC086023]|uniref:tryptophan dimethylallyltransferase family protein n=1 Tax=Streptomyces sp. NPDC086023 TaxID=3365746 RepID=UPI0037D62BA5
MDHRSTDVVWIPAHRGGQRPDTRPRRRVSSCGPRSLTGAAGGVLPGAGTLGGFTAEQLLRLCEVAGLGADDAEAYAHTLVSALGPAAERPLDLPPPNRTYLSDDHTPVEFSLSFTRGGTPALRVLLEPGCGVGSPAENGRAGLRAVREMARLWNFSTDRLDDLADLFFPADPQGPFALWCALELVPGGVPRVKVYLNPAASGQERSAGTVREALRRLGHDRAYASLPGADGYPFLALDLGDWAAPRVKVYLRHLGLSAADAGGLCRMAPGPGPEEVEEFFGVSAGAAEAGGQGWSLPLDRRPGLSCHSFTEAGAGLPSGFTLHIPVRDHVRDDAEALARAEALLGRYGMDPAPLARALSALTARRLTDGTGLIAYLALAHQRGCPPRITAYVSSEAYAVRPPSPPLHAAAR